MCSRCDPNAHEWEWEERVGEIWEDPIRGILLVLGTNAQDPRCLDCLMLRVLEYNWPEWSDGEVVPYMRHQFVLGRVDGTQMRRIL